MLDLVYLVRGQQDGTVAIEVVVQQGIVELLAIEDVETKGRLIEHQQSGVDGHDDGEVELRHHTLR